MKVFVSFSYDGKVSWYLRPPTRFDRDLLKFDTVTETLSRSEEPSIHNLIRAADVVVGVMRYGRLGLGKTALHWLKFFNCRGVCLVDRFQVNWWKVWIRRLIDWPWCTYVSYGREEEAKERLARLLENIATGSFMRRTVGGFMSWVYARLFNM